MAKCMVLLAVGDAGEACCIFEDLAEQFGSETAVLSISRAVAHMHRAEYDNAMKELQKCQSEDSSMAHKINSLCCSARLKDSDAESFQAKTQQVRQSAVLKHHPVVLKLNECS